MGSYIGRHAELYDVFYASKPYAEEAAFIHQCLQQFSFKPIRRLLELACGTGSHVLELEKFGYEITAIDYSEEMLAQARRKALEASSKINFRLNDMTDLDGISGPFDAALCLFDSIGYVVTDERIKQVFAGVSKKLRSRGLFIFEFWHAPAMLRGYEPVRVRYWSGADEQLLRISETTLDKENHLAQVTYTIYEMRLDRTYSTIKETQVNRFFELQEMKGLLVSCGFEPVKWFAGFTSNELMDDKTWHVLAIARRQS